MAEAAIARANRQFQHASPATMPGRTALLDRLHPRHRGRGDRAVRRRRRPGQGRGRTEAAGRRAGEVPAHLRPGPALGNGPELSRRAADQGHARHRDARSDPGQGRHHAHPHRGLPAGRLLSRRHLRRRGEAGRPGDRIPGQRRRARHPGAVLPDHRPDRRPGLPGRDARRSVPLAVDRVRDRPERGQVRDPGVRAVCRADAPLRIPRPDRAGARRLGHLRGAGPRRGAGRRRAGLPVHPREISFAAARRAVIATTRSGAATASLPPALITANRARVLHALARCRIIIDRHRHRHRDRKTKARLAFPHGGPVIPTLTAPARISVCGATAA